MSFSRWINGYSCDVTLQRAESCHYNPTSLTGFHPQPGEVPVFRLSERAPPMELIETCVTDNPTLFETMG